MPTWSVILCADWSKDAKKREVYAASAVTRRVWYVEAPSAGWTVETVLDKAERLRERDSPALVGFDAPIGVPASFLKLAGASRFKGWLRAISDPAFFLPVRDQRKWSIEHPFFIVPKGKGSRSTFESHLKVMGISPRRKIDELSSASPVFIAGGIVGAVGGSAADVWKGLLQAGSAVPIWPFDGTLDQLFARDVPSVVAEIYPRLAYALAVDPEINSKRKLMSQAKTQPAVRVDLMKRLFDTGSWPAREGVTVEGHWMALASEDAFDALVTAAGLLRCLLEGTPLSDPSLEDPIAEGGILGSGSLCLKGGGGVRSVGPAGPKGASRSWPCPIPGCDKVFHGSRGGWDGHVAASGIHPKWHPDVTDPKRRTEVFKEAFPEFFRR